MKNIAMYLRNSLAGIAAVLIIAAIILGPLMTNSEIKSLGMYAIQFFMVSSFFAMIHHGLENNWIKKIQQKLS